MSDVWYVRVRGEVRGPMPHEELLSQIRKKRLGRHHEVSRDALQWQRAGELRELFEPIVSVLQPAATAAVPAATATANSDTRHEPSSAAPMTASSREMTWFYAKGGSRNGPIAESELRALIAAGQLAPTDLVWNEQLETWTPLQQVPGFAPTSSAQPLIMPRENSSMPSLSPTPPLLTSSLFAVLFACISLLAIPLIFLLSAVISGNPALNNAMGAPIGSATAGMLEVLITAAIFGAMPLFAAAAGVFVGHYSLKIHKHSPGSHAGAGYALTALVLCYAILAITLLVLIVCVIVAGVKSA